MSQRSVALQELINSLSTTEKKFFRNFKPSEAEEKEQLRLFELYARHSDLAEEELVSKALKMFTEKKFLALKERLFNSICDAMCFYHKNDLINIQTYALVQKIYFLISKNLKAEAARQINMLEHLLEGSSQRWVVPLLYGIESFVYFDNQEYESFFSLLEKHEQKLIPLTEFREMIDSRNYLYATNLVNHKGHRLSAKANKNGKDFSTAYEKRYAADTPFISLHARLNHCNALVTNFSLDMNVRFKVAFQQYELVKSNPKAFTPETHILSVYNVAYLAFHNADQETGLHYTRELEQLKPATLAQKKHKIESLLKIKLTGNALLKNYSGIHELITEFEQGRKQLKMKHSEPFMGYIYHFKIFANIFSAAVSENKKWMLRFSGNEIKRNEPDLFEVYRILEIMNAIELNDFDFVVYSLRNAKLAFQKDKQLSGLLSILEEIKNALELRSFSKKEIIFKRIKELYDPLFRKDSSHLVFHYFNLHDWASLKLQENKLLKK